MPVITVVFSVVTLVLLAVTSALAQAPYPYSTWHMMGYGFGGMFISFFYLILIGLVVYLVVHAARSHAGQDHEKPVDILKKRYARGEITKEQFDQMRKDIES